MRRRAPLNLLIAAVALVAAVVAVPFASPVDPANAAHRAAPTGPPTVEVFASGGGIASGSDDVTISVVVSNPSTELVTAGHVSVSVTSSALRTPTALADYQQHPQNTPSRSLGSAQTDDVPAGGDVVVARLTVPAATLALPDTSTAVYGLAASVTTADGALDTGTGTLVVHGTAPSTVAVAAVMPITVPASGAGLISATDLATYTAAGGVLTRELIVAQQNPGLTIGVDPMVLASIRVLGQRAPASASTWLDSLAHLGNPRFALQYGDADPVLQLQAGLAAPLQPSDFAYAMSPGDHTQPLTVGEPTDTPTPTPTPTPSPTTSARLPPLSKLIGFTYSLGGMAWPAAETVRGADVTKLATAGLTTTIVSASNTNAAALTRTPDAALETSGHTALVTDDALSSALQAAANASDGTTSAVATAALNAQLALAAEGATGSTVVLAALGRTPPTDAARASIAVTTALDSSPFSRPASMEEALASPPTPGLALADHANSDARLQPTRELLDLAGEPRSGGSVPPENIASFSSVLQEPTLLTGDVRARLLDLFSVRWAGADGWEAAVDKQLTSMRSSLTAVQIVSPGTIRQASSQALIPITVTNKLAHPISVVLRATPSSARLEVDADTAKTIAADSSAKVLVPVKSQLGNGTVYLGLQLYSGSGVPVGSSHTAEIDVHADWEGVGALIFGLAVAFFFGFGLFRTIQRRRREKAEAESTDAGTDTISDGEPRG